MQWFVGNSMARRASCCKAREALRVELLGHAADQIVRKRIERGRFFSLSVQDQFSGRARARVLGRSAVSLCSMLCRVRYQKVWLNNKQGTNTLVRTGRKLVSKVLLAGDTRVKPASRRSSHVSLNQSRLRRAAPPALALSTRSSEASRNLQLWSIICLGLGLGLGLLGLGFGLG